ncbi:MAG: hypothetical protein RML12_02510 [Xanthomonadales bacterium]|nr:hypothetical protein [Xanthomonadales bacterium]
MLADPRQAVTLFLAALVGLLGLLVLAELAGLGRSYRLPDPAPPAPLPGLEAGREPLDLPAASELAAITERPVFEPSRRPPAPVQAAETPPPEAQPAVPPLDVRVTGILVTPALRLAMLRPAGAQDSVVLREGAPLPGDFAAWRIARILPRRVEFEGAAGGPPATVELEVDRTVRASAPGLATATVGEVVPAQNPDLEVQRRAEEIRRRIEERRRQLREEAARLGGPEKQ